MFIREKIFESIKITAPKTKSFSMIFAYRFFAFIATSGVFLSSFFGQSRHLRFLRLFDVEVEGGLDVSGASWVSFPINWNANSSRNNLRRESFPLW